MNVVVDALSRKLPLSLMKFPVDWKAQLAVDYSKNKFACELLDGLINDDTYKILNDVIYYKDLIFLVLESVLKRKILEVVHDAPLAGHPNFPKTYRKVRKRFSWKGLKNDMMEHVRGCLAC